MFFFSSTGGQTPDYGQIYTLLSRVMREQPPPNLTPLGKWKCNLGRGGGAEGRRGEGPPFSPFTFHPASPKEGLILRLVAIQLNPFTAKIIPLKHLKHLLEVLLFFWNKVGQYIQLLLLHPPPPHPFMYIDILVLY